MRSTASRVVGTVLSTLVAAAATWLVADFFSAGEYATAWPGWRWLAPLSLAAAWFAVVAWAVDQRLVAVPCHLVSICAPWGYLYPAPVLAIVLSLFAGTSRRRTAVATRDQAR